MNRTLAGTLSLFLIFAACSRLETAPEKAPAPAGGTPSEQKDSLNLPSLGESLNQSQNSFPGHWNDPNKVLREILGYVSNLDKDANAPENIGEMIRKGFYLPAYNPRLPDTPLSRAEVVRMMAEAGNGISGSSPEDMWTQELPGISETNADEIPAAVNQCLAHAGFILKKNGVRDPEGTRASGLVKLAIHVSSAVIRNNLDKTRQHQPSPAPLQH